MPSQNELYRSIEVRWRRPTWSSSPSLHQCRITSCSSLSSVLPSLVLTFPGSWVSAASSGVCSEDFTVGKDFLTWRLAIPFLMLPIGGRESDAGNLQERSLGQAANQLTEYNAQSLNCKQHCLSPGGVMLPGGGRWIRAQGQWPGLLCPLLGESLLPEVNTSSGGLALLPSMCGWEETHRGLAPLVVVPFQIAESWFRDHGPLACSCLLCFMFMCTFQSQINSSKECSQPLLLCALGRTPPQCCLPYDL